MDSAAYLDLEMLLSPMLNAFVPMLNAFVPMLNAFVLNVKCFCPPDWITCLEGRVAGRL